MGSSADPSTVAASRRYAITLLFATRALRLFNYGALSVVLFSYVVALGFSESQTGLLLTGISAGDLAVTLPLSTTADNVLGRRTTLVIGSMLKIFAGVAFASTRNFWVLLFAGVIGVISASGGEIGPFLAVEQACLTDVAAAEETDGDSSGRRGGKHAGSEIASLFGWYNALGYGAQALGALTSGCLVQWLRRGRGWDEVAASQVVFCGYAAIGGLMGLAYLTLPQVAEARPGAPAAPSARQRFGLRRPESVFIVVRLSVLFALDAFAGAFILQTWTAFWFSRRWGLSPDRLGSMLMAANVVSGASGVAASALVKKIGAINTMVFTHLPSNLVLMLIPLMPTAASSALTLVVRSTISQMDVPARQAYVSMVVASDERSAAGGITNIARSVGMCFPPALLGLMSEQPKLSFWFSAPFYIAGGLKIVYDLVLFFMYHWGTGLRANEQASAVADQAEATARGGLSPEQPTLVQPLLHPGTK